MYPQLTTTVRRAVILAAATLTVGALGTTTAAHAMSTVSATSSAPTACDAMAEEEAMAETTEAMAEEEAMAETTEAMAEEEAMAETTEAMAEMGDLLAVAGDAELSTFVGATEAAGLSAVLSGDGPFTVFAPSNEAFAAYLSETGIDESALLADTEALAALLSGHVVEGNVTVEALVAADGLCLTTVAGSELPVTLDDDSAIVGQATVLDAGHPASNGVVYVVDHVITS
jgi:uncharacterized surface protein with fasciclin (FAS1) repeats